MLSIYHQILSAETLFSPKKFKCSRKSKWIDQSKSKLTISLSLQPCKTNCIQSISFLFNPFKLTHKTSLLVSPRKVNHRRQVKCSVEHGGGEKKKKKKPPERRTFLTLEEAGLVEISDIVIEFAESDIEQEGCQIEELNAGKVCDWFLKDKLKREQNRDSAVLQWDDSEFQF